MPKDITDYLNEQWNVLEAAVFNSMWPEVGLSPGWYVVYYSEVPQVILGPTSKRMVEHIRYCHNSLLDRNEQGWKPWA